MSLTNLITRPCTIVQRRESGTTDAYGNDVPAETSIETVCELQQQRRAEQDDQGELSDTTWQAFFLPSEDIRGGDILIVDGVEYEMFGDPWEARNPRTRVVSHVEATLRRVAGSEDAS